MFCQLMNIEYLQLKAAEKTCVFNQCSTTCLSHSHLLSIGSWILEAGASNYIASNSSLFSKLSFLKTTHYVTLVVDASKVKATAIGQVAPLPSLSLNSVLLILGCPFNLTSISQLTRSQNCFVTFIAKSFLIQDQSI